VTKPAERRLQTFFLLGVLSNDLRITPQKGARVACSCCLQVVNVDIMVDSMEVQEVERKTKHNMGSNLLAGTARCDSRHQDGIKNVGVALQSFCNFCKGRDRLRAPALKRHASSIDSFLFFFRRKASSRSDCVRQRAVIQWRGQRCGQYVVSEFASLDSALSRLLRLRLPRQRCCIALFGEMAFGQAL